MSTLVINDLAVSKSLDKAAAMKICGGRYVGGWQAVASKQHSGGAAGRSIIDCITNNYYNVNLYQNSTIISVFNSVGNGNPNSGNLSISPLSVIDASQALLGG
jgi:hypothetical protein